MKVLIYSFAILIIFATFSVFHVDNDAFLYSQERLKHVADDCSAAASLYYDIDQFGGGYKVFNKAEGNKAIAYLIGVDLKKAPQAYYTYYFDEDGKMSEYKGSELISSKSGIAYPYIFEESRTGYKTEIKKPTVVVTIDMGNFDYRLQFISDKGLIRTSGYEYVGG